MSSHHILISRLREHIRALPNEKQIKRGNCEMIQLLVDAGASLENNEHKNTHISRESYLYSHNLPRLTFCSFSSSYEGHICVSLDFSILPRCTLTGFPFVINRGSQDAVSLLISLGAFNTPKRDTKSSAFEQAKEGGDL